MVVFFFPCYISVQIICIHFIAHKTFCEHISRQIGFKVLTMCDYSQYYNIDYYTMADLHCSETIKMDFYLCMKKSRVLKMFHKIFFLKGATCFPNLLVLILLDFSLIQYPSTFTESVYLHGFLINNFFRTL